MEASRPKVIAHVDLDAFYAQVEAKRDSSVKDKPTVVVQYNPFGDLTTLRPEENRKMPDSNGSLIAVSYEARAFGVKRNMMAQEARKLCPELNIVQVPMAHGKADLTIYRNAGAQVVEILSRKAICERASIDEAYLDVTAEAQALMQQFAGIALDLPEGADRVHVCGEDGSMQTAAAWWSRPESAWEDNERLLACGAMLVADMRASVLRELGYTCSAGVAHYKSMSKLASGLHKPMQQTMVPARAVASLLRPLPVSKLRQLGGKFGDDIMKGLGVQTVGELLQVPLSRLEVLCGEEKAVWVQRLANGVDSEEVKPRTLPKSMGCGKTFRRDRVLREFEGVRYWLGELGKELEERLENERMLHERTPRLLTVQFDLKVGPADKRGTGVSRSGALQKPTGKSMAQTAFSMLKTAIGSRKGWGITGMQLMAANFTAAPTGASTITRFLTKSPAIPLLPNPEQSGEEQNDEGENAEEQNAEGQTAEEQIVEEPHFSKPGFMVAHATPDPNPTPAHATPGPSPPPLPTTLSPNPTPLRVTPDPITTPVQAPPHPQATSMLPLVADWMHAQPPASTPAQPSSGLAVPAVTGSMDAQSSMSVQSQPSQLTQPPATLSRLDIPGSVQKQLPPSAPTPKQLASQSAPGSMYTQPKFSQVLQAQPQPMHIVPHWAEGTTWKEGSSGTNHLVQEHPACHCSQGIDVPSPRHPTHNATGLVPSPSTPMNNATHWFPPLLGSVDKAAGVRQHGSAPVPAVMSLGQLPFDPGPAVHDTAQMLHPARAVHAAGVRDSGGTANSPSAGLPSGPSSTKTMQQFSPPGAPAARSVQLPRMSIIGVPTLCIPTSSTSIPNVPMDNLTTHTVSMQSIPTPNASMQCIPATNSSMQCIPTPSASLHSIPTPIISTPGRPTSPVSNTSIGAPHVQTVPVANSTLPTAFIPMSNDQPTHSMSNHTSTSHYYSAAPKPSSQTRAASELAILADTLHNDGVQIASPNNNVALAKAPEKRIVQAQDRKQYDAQAEATNKLHAKGPNQLHANTPNKLHADIPNNFNVPAQASKVLADAHGSQAPYASSAQLAGTAAAACSGSIAPAASAPAAQPQAGTLWMGLQAADVDANVLAELPEDIRKEVEQMLGAQQPPGSAPSSSHSRAPSNAKRRKVAAGRSGQQGITQYFKQ